MPIESSIGSVAEAVTSAAPAGAPQPPPALGCEGAAEPAASGPLVSLGRALAHERILYCRLRDGSGAEADANDEIELLVSRPHLQQVAELFARLGFKPVKAPPRAAISGALESVAFDVEADRLIRIRAHHQLLMGHELTANYRLPIEDSCVSSAAHEGAFRLPAPEDELVILVLKALLRYSALDILLGRGEAPQLAGRLADLGARADPKRVRETVERALPRLGADGFLRGLESLRPSRSRLRRVKARLEVLRALSPHARRPLAMEVGLRLWRTAAGAAGRRFSRPSPKYRLASGGAWIAIVGGDGAGKSTVVDGLCAWLSKHLGIESVHLGKPRWSWTTTAIRAIVKVGQLLGLYPPESSFRETLQQKTIVSAGPWLVREMCRARDRFASYLVARRFAAAGGLVISDRFPLPQIRFMDGPLAERLLNALEGSRGAHWLSLQRGSAIAKAVVKREESYYRRYTPPEVLIVLRVDPEIAVQRRADEDVLAVRERSTEIWQVDWQHTNAHVIDAGKPRCEVLAEVKAHVWSEL